MPGPPLSIASWMTFPRRKHAGASCVYRKLNPNVLMMKSAQDGVRIYGTGSLNRTRDRRILLQRPMRSNAVVIGRIVFQNPAQMFLVQDNDVIQTLAPERSDQPFGKAIDRPKIKRHDVSRGIIRTLCHRLRYLKQRSQRSTETPCMVPPTRIPG